MNPNSRAYRDAWARIRKAIASEAEVRDISLSEAALDDMACEAAHAAFGMDATFDDRKSVGSMERIYGGGVGFPNKDDTFPGKDDK